MGSERRVRQQARHGRPAYVQRIPITTFDNITTSGSDPERSAAQLFFSLKHRLKATSGAREKQHWFRGDIREAEEAIHTVLASAKSRAMVVDPYFSADDVDLWLPSVAARGAAVQVLTSKAGLRQIKLEGLKNALLEKEHLTRLKSKLGVPTRDLNPTTLRVMRGDQSPIHDRFIVVDDRVWLLGSSLNAFGKHGTMLVELPLPAEVLPKLERVWTEESDSLDERLAELQGSAEGES